MYQLTTFIVASLALRTLAAKAPYYRPDADILEHDYIVHFNDGHTMEKHQAHIGKHLGDAEGLRVHDWLPGYRAELDDHTVHELVRNDPGVKLVENNGISYLIDPVASSEPYRMNDTTLESVAALQKRDFKGIHYYPCPPGVVMVGSGSKLTNIGNTYDMLKNAGAGVNVYVLETGITLQHKLFDGRAVNFKDMTTTPYTEPPQSMDDVNGHGTHVAGTAGARHFGVAMHATLVNVKFLDNKGKGVNDPIAKAVNDVLSEHISYRSNGNGVWRGSVINMSLGGKGKPVAMGNAVRNAYDQDTGCGCCRQR